MSPYVYDDLGRRVLAPTKGEKREKAILDHAERQLVATGPEGMTVETIATAAGITRGALYRYFRSKNDVLAALVQRVTVELVGAVRSRQNALPGDPKAAIASALTLTEDLWSRHGAVMKAAVDLSPTVPVIADLWTGARQEVVTSVQSIIAAAGIADDDSPLGARALSVVLVAMTERAFYDAAASGRSPAETSKTLNAVWLRSLRLDG